MKRLSVIGVAVLVAVMAVGCTPLQKAQGFANVIGGILAIAQAEAPAVPAADQAIYNSFVNLGLSLESQLQACIVSANSGMTKSGKFLACFNGFAAGVASPVEQAQLRLLSPGTGKKVQLYLVGVIAGVNVAVQQFGGAKVAAPVVGPAPAAAELRELRIQVERGL